MGLRKISDKELKNIELDILKYIKFICDKEGLDYYLAYGTLLGAVRHKGFIPWDDDIDIFMPRKDYERLLNLDLSSEYKILSCRNTLDYIYEFAKIVDTHTVLKECNVQNIKELGVYVDIFPLDGLPKMYNWHLGILWILTKIRILTSYIKYPFFKKIGFLSPNVIAQIINKILSKYTWDESDKILSIEGGFNEIFDKKIFDKGKQLEFEGELFNVPYLYDKYLKQCYGDYMKFPPKEKQITHHFFEAYWKY